MRLHYSLFRVEFDRNAREICYKDSPWHAPHIQRLKDSQNESQNAFNLIFLTK